MHSASTPEFSASIRDPPTLRVVVSLWGWRGPKWEFWGARVTAIGARTAYLLRHCEMKKEDKPVKSRHGCVVALSCGARFVCARHGLYISGPRARPAQASP
eukprot:scaffold13159_cov140-Isochrysis_galbana.AAC.1